MLRGCWCARHNHRSDHSNQPCSMLPCARSWRRQRAAVALVLALACMQLAHAASAPQQPDASSSAASSSSSSTSTSSSSSAASGYIDPPSGVPAFEPALWNRAYKLALRGVPASESSKELLAQLKAPHSPIVNLQLPPDCVDGSSGSFDSTPASSVPLGACFSRPGAAAGTRDYWLKVPGLALVAGNCFCYALGFFRGGYCYPGAGSSKLVDMRQAMTCAALDGAMLADGAQRITRAAALAPVAGAAAGGGGGGHVAALLARPESCIKGRCYEADFHAVRRDADGTWSWKHPGMPATNRDLFGRPVKDPEAAALPGAYTHCGYYRVHPHKMLGADAGVPRQAGPTPLAALLAKYRAMPGVSVEVTPLEYNAATDAAITPVSRGVMDEDKAWEAARGSEQYREWRVREKQALGLLPRGVMITTEKAAAGGTVGGVAEHAATTTTTTTSSSSSVAAGVHRRQRRRLQAL